MQVGIRKRFGWAVLALPFGFAAFASASEMSGDELSMRSEHYQLIKVSAAMPPPGRWDKTHESIIIDLNALKGVLDAEPGIPANVRSYIVKLTDNFSRPIYLRDALKRDDTVYFSHYWTAKDSLLNIVEYRKSGSDAALTNYLGPLSKILTASYGLAKFNFNYKGEVLSFWGVAQKDAWSLKKKYWSKAQVFLPFDDSAGIDIAVIGMQLPSNHMEPVGTFILLPNSF